MKLGKIITICLSLIILSNCSNKEKNTIDRVKELFDANQTEEALYVLNSNYNKNGWTFAAYTQKIELLLNINRIKAAKQVINSIQTTGYDKFEDYNQTMYYYYQGLIFYKSEDYYNADKYWIFAIKNIETKMQAKQTTYNDTIYYAVSNLNRGLCNIQLNDNQNAITLFNTALIWYKKCNEIKGIANTFYHKATCYSNMNNVNKALANLDSSIRYNPNYDSYIKKGKLLQQIEKYDDAINCYTEAIKLNKNKHTAFCLLGSIYKEMQNYTKAIENFDIAYLLKSDKINILVEKVKIYNEINDNYNYLKTIKKIIEQDEHNEYAQEFIIKKNNMSKIYKINKGLCYDFIEM
jgi:tetratricopeptide (TPR) repeat protein